jgi:hypothetical protein
MVEGQDVAAQMVGQGLAIVLPNGSADYGAVEAKAKSAAAGVWASKFETPADFRKAHSREPVTTTASSGHWSAPVRSTSQSGSYVYRSCAQARAAGAAPMRRGSPAYNPNLDGDNDGIACEPYRGRR